MKILDDHRGVTVTWVLELREEMKWDKTENGAVALNTTSSNCLDLFGRAGAVRNMNKDEKQIMFDSAFKENADIALKLLFYTRDIRGGYGERDTFREVGIEREGWREREKHLLTCIEICWSHKLVGTCK